MIQSLSTLDKHASRRQMIKWYDELEESEQEKLMSSADGRIPGEDADTFIKRVQVKRVVNQTIDRYDREIL